MIIHCFTLCSQIQFWVLFIFILYYYVVILFFIRILSCGHSWVLKEKISRKYICSFSWSFRENKILLYNFEIKEKCQSAHMNTMLRVHVHDINKTARLSDATRDTWWRHKCALCKYVKKSVTYTRTDRPLLEDACRIKNMF